MAMYDRGRPTDPQLIDRRDAGVGWFAHPEETGQRASHLLTGSDGVWLIDPLDIPDLDGLIAEFGDLGGVAVLSNYHTRDADSIASRHDVPIYLPTWLNRPETRLSSPLERCDTSLGTSGFEVSRYRPFPGYNEAIAYRKRDGTLYVPDALGTAPFYPLRPDLLNKY